MSEELEQQSEDLVEKAKADSASKRSIFGRIALFMRQVLIELRKVTKPTTRELVNYTGVVMAFVVIVMLILSGLDFLFFSAVQFAFTPSN